MPDDYSTAEDVVRQRSALARPDAPEGELREARVVLLGGERWAARLRESLLASRRRMGWRLEVATDLAAVERCLAEAPHSVLVVAPGRWQECRDWLLATDGPARPVLVAIVEGHQTPTADDSTLADEWLPSSEATPRRLGGICERLLEIVELRAEVERWRRRFRDLYDRSLAGLYRIDGTGVVVEANETLARLLGYDSRHAVIGLRLREFLGREELARPLSRDGKGSRPFWSRRVCLERRDGTRLWGLMNDQRLGSAEVPIFEGSLIEATREHDLALELLQQEALYVEIFGAMTEPTLLLDEHGVVLACNHRAERLLDRRALELVGRSIQEGVSELLSLEGDRLALEESPLLSAARDQGAEEAPLGVRRIDGKTLWLMVRSRRIPSPKGSASGQFLVSMVDRTDLRELSQRAQRAEVESLLTQGLVHDVRNLLTAVRAAASFLELESEDAREVREYAEQIDRVAASANVLLTRALGAKRERTSSPIEVDRLIAELTPILRRAVRNRKLTIVTGAPGQRIVGDRVELEQVLFNLLANAREALEEDGRVTLRTLVLEPEEQPPLLRIEIEDEGCGMTEEVRRHAFEPLFSSRRESGGSGLGLFNVALIARDMGGKITLDSEVGRGTIARLDLPLLDLASSERPPLAGSGPANEPELG
ncbi:MAG TPA: ATP-binding protein [Thermoanaerobaculia bacterium]|nr:ATP-binding protein [Thermoanaerobaculia bacterium]